MYFYCDPAAIEHLKKDPRMSAVIDQVGAVQREVESDLFSSVVHHIVGQQISTKAAGHHLAENARCITQRGS